MPSIRGVIDRRILVNFNIDPDAMSQVLPAPFRPQLVAGRAIGGICLIRLRGVRPAFLPMPWGLASENAAHRIAVEWDDQGEVKSGVFVPRRDTNSRLNVLAGGRLFPGEQHAASFDVEEDPREGSFAVAVHSHDEEMHMRVHGTVADTLPTSSKFRDLAEASRFFELGSLGYSATRAKTRFDGMELRCRDWHVDALDVEQVASSFFQDPSQFPPGTVEFDCALLMRNIQHKWVSRDDLHTCS